MRRNEDADEDEDEDKERQNKSQRKKRRSTENRQTAVREIPNLLCWHISYEQQGQSVTSS